MRCPGSYQFVLATLCVLSFGSVAIRGDENVVVLPSNEQAIDPCEADVWELSTRHLFDRPCRIDSENPGFRVHRYGSGCWQEREIEDALDLDGRLPIVYVHGNFMETNNTRQRVLIIDKYLRQHAHRPYRLLLLSWPSQREPHPLQDVRENAVASACQALYLAWILEALGQQAEVSILGFSLGARCITGGLHLSSGGSIHGLEYSRHEVELPRSLYRVGLVAPAMDQTWLMPRGKHQQAMLRMESIVSLYNPMDPVLRRFRFLEKGSHAVAAGYTGFVGNSAIRQYDCGSYVGKTHDEKTYFRECPYFGVVLDHLLWNESIGTTGYQ